MHLLLVVAMLLLRKQFRLLGKMCHAIKSLVLQCSYKPVRPLFCFRDSFPFLTATFYFE